MRRTAIVTWARRAVVCGILAYAVSLLLLSGRVAVLPVTVALAVLGFAGAAWWSRCTPRGDRRFALVDVVATNVAFSLLALELMLRLYSSFAGNTLLIQRNIDAYRLLPNHDYGRLWTNSFGYPSRRFDLARRPGISRLVLLGDSFAVGSVRQDENFASQIEKLRPDIEVYNFGVHATGPEDYEALLRDEALAFQPDTVLVAFFVGNDAGSRPPVGTSRPELEDHASFLLMKRTWRILREWYRLRISADTTSVALPQLAHPAVPQAGLTLSKQTYLGVEIERLVFVRRSQQSWMTENWRNALSHVGAMARLCRQRGVRFGVVIIPDEYQVNPDVLREITTTGRVPSDDIDLNLPQRTLTTFCGAEGIACLDLLPLLAGRQDSYLKQDTHWNERGNLLAAQAISSWLETSGLSRPPASVP
jgi:hypothetical protein